MTITVNPDEFFDVTIGITLVGLAVTGSLFGVSTAQAGWYYRHYPRDRRFLKMLVALIWSFDTLHLFLYGATMWVYLVRKEVSTAGVTVLPWESSAQLLCNACAIFTVQTFYSYRIWTLSQNRFLAIFLTMFIFADFGLAITLFVKSIMTTNVEDFIGLTHFDIALSSVTAATDVLLSGTLMILLANSRTGSVGANRLINKLLLYTITTGLPTSFCAIASLITVSLLPTTSIYVMFYYIGARLYSISFLATLNARQSLRIQAERIGHISLPRLTSIRHDTSKQDTWNRSPRPPEVVVTMQHGTGATLEGEQVGKEVYSRRPGSFHEQRMLEVDESTSSLRGPWEMVKFASCPVLPAY
ncbi:hypothetical protein C8Q78DRAFT_1078415 [Trametes maxima]|nr:hypothetical protein C8Q78DRAFT_1078415 [Trametes maxima]